MKLILFIVCMLGTAIVPPLRAQFLCTVTEGGEIGDNRFWDYGKLSGIGNYYIIAAKTLPDTEYGQGRIAFLYSSDGGNRWVVRDPGIADSTAGISGIDMIDSEHIFAYGGGDSANGTKPYSFLLRSTDAGVSWQQMAYPSQNFTNDVSFLSPSSGMLAAGNEPFLTMDSGWHWDTVAHSEIPISFCHDYGSGMYRAYYSYNQQIYTTGNSWSTFDSTKPIVPDTAQRTNYFLEGCSFGSGDTILTYGWHQSQGLEFPCIARTSDAGNDWAIVYDDTLGPQGYIFSVSDLSRDTVVAGVNGAINTILWSTDNGITWRLDTIECSDSNFRINLIDGISLNPEGKIIGGFNGIFPGQSVSNYLITGQFHSAEVATSSSGIQLRLFPNPATGSVMIDNEVPGTVHLLDILGRDVLDANVPTIGTAAFDVSLLPRGVYMVILEWKGIMVPVGREVLN